ncbi:Protein CBG23705 [Caenorhabditis briggsae]|uniref:COA8 family protein CBG23705, mitochondrial n=2 Tax=Caenorhabditis briggsae TaxID=6238 RepID=COA8_CAEBR|nr:Protein CBG23705 [Caenorhabditis briggsae]A8WJ42.1 RecName: Full=COA8 family protein CBG23705, mitochondrial; Short=COA8; AltName: Full=APOPT family protein CBG23705, mitochondrial; Flags: Precursor [Caenorhabditis briggsae]ULT92407.1 hypothetical protein L3Y34_009886 [Caenorhabditis briggsae]CAP20486.1 Protein CBG23705 [Caenorhabditis briggsae]
MSSLSSSSSNVRMDRRFDWVGPPDSVSKIRKIMLRRVDNESELERQYRAAREELNQWNSDFWAEHNQLFDRQKSEFVEKKQKELGRLEHVSANELSEFYRDFLNDRHVAMMVYNKEWYRRNLQLIWPALKVNVVRFFRMARR